MVQAEAGEGSETREMGAEEGFTEVAKFEARQPEEKQPDWFGLVWFGSYSFRRSDSFLQLSTSPLVVGAGADDLSPQGPQ